MTRSDISFDRRVNVFLSSAQGWFKSFNVMERRFKHESISIPQSTHEIWLKPLLFILVSNLSWWYEKSFLFGTKETIPNKNISQQQLYYQNYNCDNNCNIKVV